MVCLLYWLKFKKKGLIKLKIYKRLNQEAIFDNFRKVFVPNTPEERIRQQIAELLVSKMAVPREFIYTEYPLCRIDDSTRKRVDILVAYREKDQLYGLLVIEVKSRKIPLNDRVISQVIEYQNILGCEYIGIVNDKNIEDMIIYKVEDDGELLQIDGVPQYNELLSKIGLQFSPPFSPPERYSYKEIISTKYLEELYYDLGIIGQDTPKRLWPIIGELNNFLEAEEIDKNLPYTYGDITICEDIGSSLLNFGNASGAIFTTLYRGFIIKGLNGNDEICRIAINSVGRTVNHPKYGNRKGTTVLNVAVDNFDKASDHVLELCLDRWLKLTNKCFELWHDGRMSMIKSKIVISYISEKAPQLIKDGGIYLGMLPMNMPINWEIARELLARILLYASIRKELRELRKKGLINTIV